jgi:hypothetical protein
MQINHNIDNFFFEIFPETRNGDEAIVKLKGL